MGKPMGKHHLRILCGGGAAENWMDEFATWDLGSIVKRYQHLWRAVLVGTIV